MAEAALVAAVLTGGASRRMGRDKATLPIDGAPMAARVAAAAVAAGAAAVVAVGRPVAGLDHLPDEEAGAGPLAGLVVALAWAAGLADHPHAVVLGCDLVAPSPPAIRRAAAELARDGDAAVVAVPVVDGREQWLHACWRPAPAGTVLRDRFAAGERAVHRAVEGLAVRRYEADDPAALADADTVDELPPAAR
jgi:molybdopterin-guanine dinucleotide biosynthesis protein A